MFPVYLGEQDEAPEIQGGCAGRVAAEYQAKPVATSQLLSQAVDVINGLEDENRLLREVIRSLRGERAESAEVTEPRTTPSSELAGLPKFEFGAAAIIRAISALDGEVSQAVSLLVDAYIYRSVPDSEVSCQADAVRDYGEVVNDVFWVPLTNQLGRESQVVSAHGGTGRLLVRVLMLLIISRQCELALEAQPTRFYDSTRLNKMFTAINESAGSTFTGDWRSLHQGLLKPALEGWVEHIMDTVSIHMCFLGWRFRTAQESAPFAKHLPSIFYAICELRWALEREAYTSGEDLELYMAEQGEEYDSAQMEDIFGGASDSDETTEPRASSDEVAGPCGFGLRKVWPVKTRSGGYERKAVILKMPKVIRTSTVQRAIDMHRNGDFRD